MREEEMLKRKPKLDPVVRDFFNAVKSRDYKKVKHVLKSKCVEPDVRDVEDAHQPTALLVASEMNDEELAWLLLKSKTRPADVNAETVKGRRAVWWAAKHGSKALAEVLLRKPGCDVNVIDKETGGNISAIAQCDAQEAHQEKGRYRRDRKGVKAKDPHFRRLLRQALGYWGPILSPETPQGTQCGNQLRLSHILKQPSRGCTPLYRAIISNSESVVQQLIHAGADVNMRRLGYSVGAETPLIKSVQLNNKAICECLINSLCNIQAKTEDGLTALHFAVAFRRYDICKVLLESKIKVQAKSKHGVTAMTIAIEHFNPAMVKILVHYGYNVDKRYKWKETPLEQAIHLHSEICAITLVHCGCSIDTLRGKRSYFYMAVNEKLFSLVRLLIDVRPSFLNERWLWTLQWPVSVYQRLDICKWLLKESQTVRTLKHQCRVKIFKILGRHSPSKADKLPLPLNLKEYLKYSHHIREDFYVERPLDTEECPFDCPSLCPIKYCPVLDISDSETDSDDFLM